MAPGNDECHSNNQDAILRPLADFPENIWIGRFNSPIMDKQEYDIRAKETEKLKEEVRSMLIEAKEKETIEKMNLIDTVERLGISYHFDKEIDELMEEIFQKFNASFEESPQNDLFATALLFRLLRQHGYDVSSDMFSQFLNGSGKFKEALSSDIKGLLSLYETAHVRTHKDRVLEEALSFTATHLKSGGPKMPSFLAKQVNHALVQSLHRDVPRVLARHYISAYEEDECKNPLLLRFAKLDFSLLQVQHRQELQELIRWVEELEIMTKVPYSRDRLVECYFWGLATFFEPRYSVCRILSAKTSVFITIIDDTYDAYGTVDELQAFKDAIERWDIKETDRLPEYMKPIYLGLLGVAEWIDEELTKQGKSRPYASSLYKDAWKQYVRASYKQSTWFLRRELPEFPDYKEVAVITSAYFIITPASLLFMESATKYVFDWLSRNPKIVVGAATIGRFINDIASNESEKQRGATGLECYMKHFNVSEEEATKELEGIAEDAWKDINEEFLGPTAMPREILMPVLNLARILDITYKYNLDGYTDPKLVLEPHIVAVLVDPMIV